MLKLFVLEVSILTLSPPTLEEDKTALNKCQYFYLVKFTEM